MYDFKLNDSMPFKRKLSWISVFQNFHFDSRVICTFTKHLNLLDLYINNDIASSHNKKNWEIKDDCTICFQNQPFNSTWQFVGLMLVGFLFCLRNHSVFCYPISYSLIGSIVSQSLQFIYRETAGNFYYHTSWK